MFTDIKVFFKNHFINSRIGDNRFLEFVDHNIACMTQNNPGGIYSTLLSETISIRGSLRDAVNGKAVKDAFKQGATLNVYNKMRNFKKNISQKEGLIKGIYGKQSPKYQEFFPQKVKEYVHSNLKNIEILMDTFVNVCIRNQTDVGADFVTLFTNLKNEFKTARTAQLILIGEWQGKRAEAKKFRQLLELQMMKNILYIASQNAGKLKASGVYFEQGILRRRVKRKKKKQTEKKK